MLCCVNNVRILNAIVIVKIIFFRLCIMWAPETKKSLSYIHQRYTKFLQYYYKHNARTASVLVIEKWFVILDRIMTEAFLWALYNNYISLTFHFELNGCYVYIWRRWKICFMPRLNPLKSLSSIFFTSNALIKPSSVNHVMRQLKYSSFFLFYSNITSWSLAIYHSPASKFATRWRKIECRRQFVNFRCDLAIFHIKKEVFYALYANFRSWWQGKMLHVKMTGRKWALRYFDDNNDNLFE